MIRSPFEIMWVKCCPSIRSGRTNWAVRATQHYEADVGKAIVAVLEHNGFEVILPPQNCCGLPMQSNGNREIIAPNAAREE